jgi:DnaJ-class molecular chaperone
MNLSECYKLIGVNRSSSLEEINSQYRKRVSKLHPDLNPGKDLQPEIKRLNNAYDILKSSVSESRSYTKIEISNDGSLSEEDIQIIIMMMREVFGR